MKTFLTTTIAFCLFALACSAQNNTFPVPAGNVGIGTSTPNTKLEIQMPTSITPLTAADEGLRLSTSTASTSNSTHISSPFIRLVGGIWNGTVNSNRSFTQQVTGISLTNNGYRFALGSTDVANILSITGLTGNVGIGTTTPGLRTHILGPRGFAVDSGTVQTGVLRLQGVGSNGVLDFSVNGGSGSSIQVTSLLDLSQTFPLILNPHGGNIGIGTTHPDQALTVNGQVHATSVLIESAVPADYVFNTDYYLRPLTDVKTYVDKNHHLPEVPSAAEFKRDGMNVGDMNMTLLKKVEEMTLYLIELNKTVAAQQKEIERLKKDKK